MGNNVNILSVEEIRSRLKSLPEWEWDFRENKISKDYEFPSFKELMDFVNDLVPFFEENKHHPNMTITYRNIIFELTHHDSGGKLTDKDILVAKEIEDRFNQFQENKS